MKMTFNQRVEKLNTIRAQIGLAPMKIHGTSAQTVQILINRYEAIARHNVDNLMSMHYTDIASQFQISDSESQTVYNFINRSRI